MKLPKITFVHDNEGDWMGVYLDGKLAAERHSFDEDDRHIRYTDHPISVSLDRHGRCTTTRESVGYQVKLAQVSALAPDQDASFLLSMHLIKLSEGRIQI